MALRSASILAVVMLSLMAAASSAEGLPGGWQKIEDPNAPEVVDIARFAVAQHNRDAKTRLGFDQVVSGQRQVVEGVNYKLVISVQDEVGQLNDYEAVVWSRPWLKSRKLISFKEVNRKV